MRLAELFEARTKNTAWVILHNGNKIILGKRSPSTKNPNQWNFFGGHVDDGETPSQAAVRELEEETTLKLDPSSLKRIATINGATYFSARLTGSVIKTTSEISSIKSYSITDLPDNMHSKTQAFFDNLDAWL